MEKLCKCNDCWSSCFGIRKWLRGKVTWTATHLKFIPCVVLRQAIAAKKWEPDMHKVLQDVINVVNFVKTRLRNSRIFTVLPNEMGSDHKNPLYHTDICWLSHGNGLLKDLLNLKTSYTFFFYKKRSVLNLLIFSVMTRVCQ